MASSPSISPNKTAEWLDDWIPHISPGARVRKPNEMKDLTGSDACTRRSSAGKEVPHEQGDQDWSRNHRRRWCCGRGRDLHELEHVRSHRCYGLELCALS